MLQTGGGLDLFQQLGRILDRAQAGGANASIEKPSERLHFLVGERRKLVPHATISQFAPSDMTRTSFAPPPATVERAVVAVASETKASEPG